jgi:hypothetical protein
MGTNYYRVPKSHEVVEKMQKLNMRIGEMDLWSASDAKNEFRTIPITEYQNATPWDEFIDRMSVHLGKRSSGWKFCWNFHDDAHYSNKEELLGFIRSGRVVDEYGMEIEPEEFIKMALEWGEPDGAVLDAKYEEEYQKKYPNYRPHGPKYYDRIVDGLRVSTSTDFS